MTDRDALLRNRQRALRNPEYFLFEFVRDEIKERLIEVNKSFKSVAIVTGFKSFWSESFPVAKVVEDTDVLDLEIEAYDLIIHSLSLHWANDPVGQIIQCRRALKPDGLLLVTLFGGNTLFELREAIGAAEISVSGGLSPRIAPMGEIRDLGGLLQRAGLALPVADTSPIIATYDCLRKLVRDIRGMGEGNALAQRLKHPSKRSIFNETERYYLENHSAPNNRINATFEIVTLTGWAPDASQQKPLRPGSAQSRLADALKTDEMPLVIRTAKD